MPAPPAGAGHWLCGCEEGRGFERQGHVQVVTAQADACWQGWKKWRQMGTVGRQRGAGPVPAAVGTKPLCVRLPEHRRLRLAGSLPSLFPRHTVPSGPDGRVHMGIRWRVNPGVAVATSGLRMSRSAVEGQAVAKDLCSAGFCVSLLYGASSPEGGRV